MVTYSRVVPQWEGEQYRRRYVMKVLEPVQREPVDAVESNIEEGDIEEVYDTDFGGSQDDDEETEHPSSSSESDIIDDYESDDDATESCFSSYYSITDLSTIEEETAQDLLNEDLSVHSTLQSGDEVDDLLGRSRRYFSDPYSSNPEGKTPTIQNRRLLLAGDEKWNSDGHPRSRHNQGVPSLPVRHLSRSMNSAVIPEGEHLNKDNNDALFSLPRTYFMWDESLLQMETDRTTVRSSVDPPSSLDTTHHATVHNTNSENSKNTRSTASVTSHSCGSDDDAYDEFPSNDLLDRNTSRLSLVSYRTGEVVDLPVSDDEYTYVSYCSVDDDDSDSVISLSSVHSSKSLSAHSSHGIVLVEQLFEDVGDGHCPPDPEGTVLSSIPMSTSGTELPIVTMDLINEDTAMIQGSSIDFHQSRKALFGRLVKAETFYGDVPKQRHQNQPLPPEASDSAALAMLADDDISPPRSPQQQQRMHRLRRRLEQQRVGGERRRRLFDKNKALIRDKLDRRLLRLGGLGVLEGIGGGDSSTSDHDVCSQPARAVLTSTSTTGNVQQVGTVIPQDLMDRLGGLQRRKSFDESKDRLQVSLARAMSEGNFTALAIENPKLHNLIHRQVLLKHRIKVERYSGEQRRRAYERSRRMVEQKVETTLRGNRMLIAAAQELDQQREQHQQRLPPNRPKKGIRILNVKKSQSSSHKDAPIPKPTDRERMGGLLQEISYTKSRGVVQDSVGTELYHKATGGMHGPGQTKTITLRRKKSSSFSPDKSLKCQVGSELRDGIDDNSDCPTNDGMSPPPKTNSSITAEHDGLTSLGHCWLTIPTDGCSKLGLTDESVLEQKRLKGKLARDRLRKAFSTFAETKVEADEDNSSTSNLTDTSDELDISMEQIVRTLQRSPSRRGLVKMESASRKLQDALKGVPSRGSTTVSKSL